MPEEEKIEDILMETEGVPKTPEVRPVVEKVPVEEKKVRVFPLGTILKIVGLVVLVALIGFGGYKGFVTLRSRLLQPRLEPPKVGEEVRPEEVAPVVPVMPLDTDGDGLSDQEEILLATDLNKLDTDNDGLNDREEAKVYKTDPHNPDSDGDGYKDGEEVRANYNPLGPGRLMDFWKELEKLR